MTPPIMRNNVGRQTLDVDNTAGGLQLTVPDTARHALIWINGTASTNDVRMTGDGTAPVASTTGVLLTAAQRIDIFMDPMGDFHQILTDMKFIREGGSSGSLDVEYYD